MRGLLRSARIFVITLPVLMVLAAPSPSFAQQQATALEEVLVTARKREENIQQTPIAISAISGDALREQGINNSRELTKTVPSLEIRRGQANQIYIRGIGERTGFARVDPAVGVYLDDIFLPRSDGQLLDTVDVRSIQVLRGPQGTLFGKNTTGGAMVMNVIKAHDGEEAFIEAGLGNYGRKRLKAGINRPITDRLFMRVAVNSVKDDGYFENIAQQRNNPTNDRQSLLLQSTWQPSDDWEMDGLLFYGKVRENFPGINCRPVNENALLVRGLWLNYPGDKDPSNPQAYHANCAANSREALGDLKGNQGPNPQLDKDLDTYLLGLTARWQWRENMQWKAVFSARDAKEGPIQASDADGGPAQWSSNQNTEDSDRQSFSAELQLTGDLMEGALSFAAGAFAMHETNGENFTSSNVFTGIDSQTLGELTNGGPLTQPPQGGTIPVVGMLLAPLTSSTFDLQNTTLGLFTQWSWQMHDNLELTGGLRWTSEERESQLTVFTADRDAISNRIISTGLFGPSVEGLHTYNGPGRWDDDPISIAAALYSDGDGDGLIDYPMLSTPTREDKASDTFRQFTPMVSLAWRVPEQWFDNSVADSLMLYATWSSGFKSGFFEPRGVDGLQRIEPERLENTELGFKLDAFDRRLRFNGAAYYMDYKDMQLIQVGTDSGNNLVVVFTNAGRSEVIGAELELQWLPIDGLMINASMSNNQYTFKEFSELDLNQAVFGNEVVVDRTDETFPVSPETTASLGVQYEYQGDGWSLTPRLDLSYKSDIFYGFDPASYRFYKEDIDSAGQPAYWLADARLSWRSHDQSLTIAGWVKNLTDKRYLIGVASVADSSATFTQAWGEPRMWGFDIYRTF